MKENTILLLAIFMAISSVGALAQNAGASPDPLPSVTTPAPMQAAFPADSAVSPVQPAATSTHQAGPIDFRRDGLWFSTSNKHTQLHIHGYVQAENRMFSANTHGERLDTFLFRRIRPLFEGTLFNEVDFRVMPDFGQNNPQIQEAFLEWKTLSFAKLRVGKFKEPIGLEVLRQDRDLTFVERSLASDLVPLRYIGAQLSGAVLSNSITYEAGYFDGSNDGSNGVFTQWARGNEGAVRAFLHPFAKSGIEAIQHFGIGIGGSAGDQHGTIAGLKTIGQTTFFKYSSNAVADGQHNRLAPQAYYYGGRFGLMGEYVISSQEVLNNRITGRVRNEAWQVEGSVLLTGEKNGYAGVRARNPFEPARGFDHFGALELAFRYSQVRIDGNAFPLFANAATAAQIAGETGIGLNWYLTRYVKLQTDYEHTGFRMASGSATPLHSENLLLSQIQMAF
jgi:phosphate-selective porin OprO and OprP